MSSVPDNLLLPFGDAPPPAPLPVAPAADGVQAAEIRRLWLCLHLPELPLEVMAGGAGRTPRVVVDPARQRPVVAFCNAVAVRQGVQPGMSVNAALALSPGLELHTREPALEQAALERLATGALRFTPQLVLEADALLLEIAASLPLFGGAAALRTAAVAEVEAQGHRVLAAVAPTARAALWLARLHHAVLLTGPAHLPGVLGRLPVAGLGWPAEVQQALRRLGVTRLGECMRLPRDGLARRIGSACLRELDEALGRAPESRPAWRQPSHWQETLELPVETHDTGLVLVALRRLLDRLVAWLRVRQAAVTALRLGLQHRSSPATRLRIGLLQPGTDAAHLAGLAAIHLAAIRLPAPVSAVALEAEETVAATAAAAALPGLGYDRGERIAGLVERLRLRLGLHAVHGVWPAPGHRPEHAWRVLPVPPPGRQAAGEAPARASRPLWLLAQPAALDVRAGTPLLGGPLALERGPERIETGWWDGDDVRRDYYVARDRRGVRAWVFRDCRSGGWYLHGLFG